VAIVVHTGDMTDLVASRPPAPRQARSKRGEVSRAALLAAAARVFAVSGYANANVNDIVDQAGMSVGSLYHHFSSKADIYIELFNDYQSRQQHRSARAFRAALAAGEEDPCALFLAGTRAYLEGAWQDRHVARIFMPGGGPPGFDHLLRRQFRTWLQNNTDGLGPRADELGPTLLLVLTTISNEAGRDVAVQTSKARATAFIDEILLYMSQLRPLGERNAGQPGAAGPVEIA
jgi:AcrR family transcriptional regulator